MSVPSASWEYMMDHTRVMIEYEKTDKHSGAQSIAGVSGSM